MKTEQAVDVFQAIKMIRGTRPQFVENTVSNHDLVGMLVYVGRYPHRCCYKNSSNTTNMMYLDGNQNGLVNRQQGMIYVKF